MPIDIDDPYAPEEPDEFDVCHHGVGFDEDCEACDDEIDADPELCGLVAEDED